MMDEDLEKSICRWLLFAYTHSDNPWKMWAELGRVGLNRREVDSYLLKRGYNPFEGGAYIKFVKENFKYVVEKAHDP
jgi:hypothetical protein